MRVPEVLLKVRRPVYAQLIVMIAYCLRGCMSAIEGKTILLVGGAGFIGHHLALRLKAAGADVHIMDSLQVNNLLSFVGSTPDGQPQDLYRDIVNERFRLIYRAGIPLHIQDARDYHGLSKIFHIVNPEIVVHLAAVSHADRSNKDPYSTFDHSLRTLENALDCSRDKVKHFIYFSSSMVYGNFKEASVTEESLCEPVGIYGALKFAGEKMVIAYNQVFNLPYTIVRPSALYGERCVSRRVGQIFIESALREIEISVNGDGSDRLDFTYVSDLVAGIQLTMENDAAKNEIFNLTYGESRSIAELSAILSQYFESPKFKFQSRDSLTPKRGTLSVEKAKQLLGYNPQFPIEKGFVDYITWYQNWYTSRSHRQIEDDIEILRVDESNRRNGSAHKATDIIQTSSLSSVSRNRTQKAKQE